MSGWALVCACTVVCDFQLLLMFCFIELHHIESHSALFIIVLYICLYIPVIVPDGYNTALYSLTHWYCIVHIMTVLCMAGSVCDSINTLKLYAHVCICSTIFYWFDLIFRTCFLGNF